MTIKRKKYISLKDAAELTGYSQDYLGQLIRKGSLPGKKVYANVAWMTTEEDLQLYIHGLKNGNGNGAKNGNGRKSLRKKNGGNGGRFSITPQKATRPFLYFVGGFLAAAVFALFYILAVNVDRQLEDRAVEQISVEDMEMFEMEFAEPEGGYQSF